MKLINKIVINQSLFFGFTIMILFGLTFSVKAQVMSSTNYKLESDSVNFGGNRSSSGSYTVEDTLGEIATGISSSTNYTVWAGYQQVSDINIYVVPAGNVSMSPNIPGLTGGSSDGQTTTTVTTDNPAGYAIAMKAQSSPALITSYDSFADYAPAGLVPDYTFNNPSSDSSFAFTVEGNDIATRYKNSGLTCGVGSDDDVDACWDGLSTTNRTIVSRNSSNQPVGTVTTIKFHAASGSSHVQEDGVYVATTTITVTSL